jgi:hypothetical protein
MQSGKFIGAPSMLRTKLLLLILVFAVLILSTCESGNSGTTTMDTDAIHTEAVATYLADQTRAALVSPSAPVPTFTPASPATETPSSGTPTTIMLPTASTCYKLLFKKVETIPDGTQMDAGQNFTKTWKVQNNGSCAWAPGFKFRLIGGEAMGGQTLTLTEPVPIGAITELSIEMEAPSDRNGLVAGTWQMSDADGAFFGDALTVVISMGEPLATLTITKSP